MRDYMLMQIATPEEQMIYDAFYEYARYLYSNWKGVLNREPQLAEDSTKRAFVTALAILEAENAGIPQERIQGTQEQAMREAMLKISEDGGPFRVRYVIVRAKDANTPEDYEVITGHGEPDPLLVEGLTHDCIQFDQRSLFLNIYRESFYPKEDVQVFALSLDDEGTLN